MEQYLTVENITGVLSFIYGVVLYLLPKEKAEKLNVISKALTSIVNTPAGFKFK